MCGRTGTLSTIRGNLMTQYEYSISETLAVTNFAFALDDCISILRPRHEIASVARAFQILTDRRICGALDYAHLAKHL
jgi:hypothetical protein